LSDGKGAGLRFSEELKEAVSSLPERFRRCRRHLGPRWLLPLLFVFGYLATFRQFEPYASGYAVLTASSFLACCLLLGRMGCPFHVALPFWVILAVFMVGYFFKFYWIAAFPSETIFYDIFNMDVSAIDAQFSAFATAVYAFVTFSLAAWTLIGLSRRGKKIAPGPDTEAEMHVGAEGCRAASSIALWVSLFLIVATTYILQVSGIAVMGVEAISLPFRFSGIVFYTRSVFIPAMLLLLILCSRKAGLNGRAGIGIALIVVYGLSDMFLRSSKGGLATLLLSLLFLVLIDRWKIRRAHIVFFGACGLLLSLLFPLVSVFRNLRIDTGSLEIFSLLADAFQDLAGDDVRDFRDVMMLGFGSIIFRIVGVDILIALNSMGAEPLRDVAWAVLTSERGLSGYVTVDVFGFSPDAVHSVAPSLVGWFYLLGGNGFVVLGIAWFTAIGFVLWRLLSGLRLKSIIVADVLFMSLFTTMAVDGTLDSFFTWKMIVWPVSVVVCEWILRISRGPETLSAALSA